MRSFTGEASTADVVAAERKNSRGFLQLRPVGRDLWTFLNIGPFWHKNLNAPIRTMEIPRRPAEACVSRSTAARLSQKKIDGSGVLHPQPSRCHNHWFGTFFPRQSGQVSRCALLIGSYFKWLRAIIISKGPLRQHLRLCNRFQFVAQFNCSH